MKNAKTLIILLVALVILGGLYAAVKLSAAKEEAAEEDLDFVTPLDTVEDVREMSISFGSETYTLTYENETWFLEDEREFPLDQTKVQAMADSLLSIFADKELGDAKEGEEYGLEDPQCIITVTASDGCAYTYRIGAYNDYAKLYYLKEDGFEPLYMVDSTLPDLFFKGKWELILMERVPDLYTDEIEKVTLTRGEDVLTFKKTDETYSIVYPTMTTADAAAAKELISSFTGLYFYSCAAYGADSADELAPYGLDKPSAVMTVFYTRSETRDTGKTDENGDAIKETVDVTYDYTISFGADSGDGYTYVQPQDSDKVYRVSVSEAHIIIDADLSEGK